MSDRIDVLFKLIRSLTSSEKRHFSLYAARHTIGKENNSLRMFKKLQALQKYNEKEFLAQNKKEGFVKHYGFNKHFLYKLILRSLHSFHSGKTAESELRDQLHHIDILTEKGLLAQARALLKMARKKAGMYQLHTLNLELMNREMWLNREEAFAGKSLGDIKKHAADYQEELKKLGAQMELETLTARAALEASKGGLVRNKKTFAELYKLQKSRALKNVPQGFYPAWHFYSAKVGLHYLTLQTKKAFRENEALLQLMEVSPHMIRENPRYYLLSLNNRMVLLSIFRRYEEMLATAKKMEAVPVRSQTLRNRKFNTSNTLILQMYVKTGNFEKGLTFLRSANSLLASGQVQFLNLQFEITHYLGAANLHFGMQDFALANRSLGQIVDRSDLILRSDILCFSVIMRMIVQYEMQKQDLLEYSVRSAYRFLYKRQRLYKFEGIILDFIRKRSPYLDSHKKVVEAFKELLKKLVPLTRDPYEKNAFAYFDIISWLESKIQNRPFGEVVRSNYLLEIKK